MFVGSGRYPFGLILPVHDHENVIQAVWNRFMSSVDSRLSLMHKRACQQFGAAWSYDSVSFIGLRALSFWTHSCHMT